MTMLAWWQKAVFYQIYPRSFADRNGDGIGDLAGIIEHLDYLKDLGIDAIWLSPHYPSPQFDCGYDISDYENVAPEYGTLDEFKRFLDEAHRRDIRVILDLVLNHTSHLHPWFIESRSSRDNPKRDWYIWRDGKDGGPPNNWYSIFGGSAWEYDPTTGQYYYHFFLKEQPDLNWRNPKVKEAMFNVVRFWLNMGVDGFRLDAVGTIFEDPDFRDHRSRFTQADLYKALLAIRGEEKGRAAYLQEKTGEMFRYQRDLPEVHDLMQELRAVVDEFPDRVLVGEADDIAYYGDGTNELHLVFNFPLMRTDRLTPAWVRANQQDRLSALPPGAWPCNTLSNHDSPRIISHFGDGEHDAEWARICLALMLTLKGTPFLYYGEEIGMTNLPLEDIGQFRDTLGIRAYHTLIQELGMSPTEALAIANEVGRDKCRTPMQWASAPNAGFSPAGVQTWLPVNPNYAQGVNVADQTEDPNSLLSFYRHLLAVRRRTPALIDGDYVPLHEDAEDYLAFLRRSEASGQSCLIVLNMSDRPQKLDFDKNGRAARLIFSSRDRPTSEDPLSALPIGPFEVYIGELIG
ncbi:MAG: alpha-glucosidase [Anaerolineae bacterium]|nr:alpha-glucosidase [Anaerolineae bacterium]